MEQSRMVQHIEKIVTIILVALAMSLTFAVGVRERRCAPLELEFEIDPKTEQGDSWDRGSATSQAPDPIGWVSVTTDGKRYGESIAQRKNTFDFSGRFYSGRGVPLRRGSTITVRLFDKDWPGAQGISEIEHTVLLPSRGSASSNDKIVELAYKCHSDSSPLDFFSSLKKDLFSSLRKDFFSSLKKDLFSWLKKK
jgi:hypothetical protein